MLGQVIKLNREPPIHVIPKLLKHRDLTEKGSMSIKISEGLKKTYNKFVGRTTEEALQNVLLLWSIESQLEYL